MYGEYRRWLFAVLIIPMFIESVDFSFRGAFALMSRVSDHFVTTADVSSARLILEALTGFHVPVLAFRASN